MTPDRGDKDDRTTVQGTKRMSEHFPTHIRSSQGGDGTLRDVSTLGSTLGRMVGGVGTTESPSSGGLDRNPFKFVLEAQVRT